MTLVRWTTHTLQYLADRKIPRDEADQTLAKPESVVPDLLGRWILMRRYYDKTLQ
jgi:hypothetical protein